MTYRPYDYFEPSRPREAKGGIKAQSGRGGFGRSWWARRWIEVLEGFDLGARLGRGRSYARRGQVLSVDVEKGAVTARVQGSRARPYRVEIKVKTLGGSDWKKLTTALFRRPIFAAKLLAGQMPENIEDAFRDAGLSLFPDRGDDLETNCSCPDWSNPCKHVAAVYLLLGEEFDRDPFLVFKLRGVEREELVGLVGRQTAARSKAGGYEATLGSFSEQAPGHSPPEPLPAEPDEFWGQANAEGDGNALGVARIPTISAALPKRLGSFPFWRGKESFIPALEEVYRKASPAGLDVFLGERRVSERSRAAGPEG